MISIKNSGWAIASSAPSSRILLSGAAGFAMALSLTPAIADMQNFSFSFFNSNGVEVGTGTMTFDMSGSSVSPTISLSDVTNFSANLQIGNDVWTPASSGGQYSGGSGANPLFGRGSLTLLSGWRGDGSDWFWDDFENGNGDSNIVFFENDRSKLFFDEGDDGSRDYRVVMLSDGSILLSGRYQLIGPAYSSVTPEEALSGISFTSNTSATAMVIAPACVASNSANPGSRFTQDCNALVGAAMSGDDQAAAALGAITAEEATVPLTSARASMGMQRQILSARLAALRGGGANSGLAMQTAPGFDGFTANGMTGGAASADNASGQVFGDERFGVFFNGNGSAGDKDGTQNESGFDFDTWNLAFGADYRLRDNLILGLAGGYSKNDVKLDNNGGRLDSESYSLSLYGSFFHGDHLYVDGILSYASNDYDQKRNVIYGLGSGGANQTASADYDGDQWSAALNAGYSLSWGALTYGPVARLEYVNASVDGYRERMSDPNAAGGGWATRMDDISQDSFTLALGGEVSQAISTTWGVLLPQLHLSWVHEFKNDALSVNGSFIEDPINGVFRIRADRPDTDYFNARLGVSAQLAGGVSAFVYYNTVLGYRDLDVDTIGAGVRMTF